MRRFTARLFVASLTFLIGLTAVTAWSARRHSPRAPDFATPEPPCREGLISVAAQPNAPLRVSILAATCQSLHTPRVSFEVENVGTRPVASYVVYLLEEYHGRARMGGSGVGPNGVNIQPRQTLAESVGGSGLLYGPDGLPAPGLKGYVLAVCSVRFTDGTAWDAAPLCE